MKHDAILQPRQVRLLGSPDAVDSSPASLRVPPWWRGSVAEYRPIYAARCEIQSHDRAMARRALAMMMGSVLAAAIIYSVDAAGASPGFGGSAAMLVAAVSLLVLTGLWILDRRQVQQFRDARLQALVWNDLVIAVRQGAVDLSAIAAAAPFEREVECLLRRELAVVARYLESQEDLELHLSLFESGIKLTRA